MVLRYFQSRFGCIVKTNTHILGRAIKKGARLGELSDGRMIVILDDEVGSVLGKEGLLAVHQLRPCSAGARYELVQWPGKTYPPDQTGPCLPEGD